MFLNVFNMKANEIFIEYLLLGIVVLKKVLKNFARLYDGLSMLLMINLIPHSCIFGVYRGFTAHAMKVSICKTITTFAIIFKSVLACDSIFPL